MADISKEQVDALLRRLAPVREPKFWTDFAQACFKLGRNAGLEEAAKICTELAELNRKAMTDSMWQQEECAAIESLKDNTP